MVGECGGCDAARGAVAAAGGAGGGGVRRELAPPRRGRQRGALGVPVRPTRKHRTRGTH